MDNRFTIVYPKCNDSFIFIIFSQFLKLAEMPNYYCCCSCTGQHDMVLYISDLLQLCNGGQFFMKNEGKISEWYFITYIHRCEFQVLNFIIKFSDLKCKLTLTLSDGYHLYSQLLPNTKLYLQHCLLTF